MKNILYYLKKLNWFGLFLLSQFPMTLLVLLPSLQGRTSFTNLDTLIFLLVFSLITVVTYFYARKLEVIPKIESKYFQNKEILIGFVALFIASVLAGIISTALGTTETANQDELNKLMKAIPLIVFTISTVSAGFFEEIVFRASFFELLFPKYPKIAAVMAVLVFALIHNPTDLGSLVIYLSMSLVLTGLYYKYRNFYVNMAVHSLWNLMVTITSIYTLK